ncbi:hypothetical protein [Streptosporangium sp. NPDC087985]|uniref:hypothetical protein n=1 Tax=Streptosporangium sp. NPDC087985 TaxID=3366196 RepID=UPI0037F5FE37
MAYATVEDLRTWLSDTPPTGAERMLNRATRYIDNVLLKTSIYDVDEDGQPTDDTVTAALRDACCATVEWWDANGDDGIAAGSDYSNVTAGSISLSKASRTDPTGGAVDPRRAPEAVEILDAAGLLGHAPRTYP